MKKTGQRLLIGLEDGELTGNDAYTIALTLDPVLVFFIIRYLREKYQVGRQSVQQGVVNRLLEFTSAYPDIVEMSQKGETDPVREWFDDAYSMNEFFNNSEELVALIVEKLES